MTPEESRLSPAQHARALAALRATSPDDPLDVLIVGAGVVGAGAALDAVSRGLRVGIVERRDIAAGTSSRSSRLAHGGLRYLEQREFALVHEALTERGLLLDRIAPHFVRPVPFLYPVTHRGWERPYVGAGIALYDMLSRVGAYGGTMPRPHQLSKAAVAGIAPGLDPDALVGAVRYYDAQTDDVRHTVALARSAAERGANVATRVSVVGLLRDDAEVSADGDARVVGAVLQDEDTGERWNAFARTVVGCAGVWTDELRSLAHDTGAAEVRQSKGVHLVIPRAAFQSTSAVIARTPTSVLFMLPWGRHWLVGTTDTDYDGALDEPTVTAGDVDYLIGQANRWLARHLTHDDVVGVYSGLRPLLSAGTTSETTASLSREHAVVRPAPGFVVIAGGKWTTYRVMASDVVDAAVDELATLDPERWPGERPECVTADIPVVGAEGFAEAWAARERTARRIGISSEAIEALLRRHGSGVDDVLAVIDEDPSLARPLHPDELYLRAEVVVAARNEGARSVEDVLVRRLRLALEVRDALGPVADEVAALMAPDLGWSAGEAADAAELFRTSPRALVPAPAPAHDPAHGQPEGEKLTT